MRESQDQGGDGFRADGGPGQPEAQFLSGFRDPLPPGYGGNHNNMNVYFKRFKFKRCNVFVHSCSFDNHAKCQRHHEDRPEAHEGAQAQPLAVVPPVASGDGRQGPPKSTYVSSIFGWVQDGSGWVPDGTLNWICLWFSRRNCASLLFIPFR